MGEIQAALSTDDPRLIAWEAYKKTSAFDNSKRWAENGHAEGSLWAAFLEGFEAAKRAPEPTDQPEDGR